MRQMLCAVALAAAGISAHAAPWVFSDVTTGGAADPGFNALINNFRAELGALNAPGACAPGPCLVGRREINWDAVPSGSSSPNPFAGNFFNGEAGVQPAGRQRGLSMTTPGTGFRVSATEFSDEASFNSAAEFEAFSPARLFASMGNPITDVVFSVPGSPSTVATVRGFGVVFSDVDHTGSTSMQFFDANGASLGSFAVPGVSPSPSTANSEGSFSFLGVAFGAGERVARVRIVSGARGVDGTFAGLDDAVVMDDFIYSEPLAVPEPATWALMLSGLVVGGALARRRKHALRH